jgi:hypothetical protein
MRFSMVVMLLALTAASASAQARRAPVLLELPASVRAAALGNAFPLGSVDANAIFHNAAFGESLRGVSGGAHVHGTRSVLHSVAGGLEWWGAAVAVGVQSVSYTPDPGGSNAAVDQMFGGGDQAAAEQVASLAYARRVRGVRVAVTGKWVEQRVDVERNSTAAADVSAGMNFGPVGVGLAVQNLGPGLTVAERTVPLPDRVTLGASFLRSLPVGPVDLLGTVSTGRDTYGDFFAGGGLEVSWWPVVGRTFSARIGGASTGAGAAASPLTVGAGFTGDRIALDYAFRSYGALGDAHLVGVRWR